MDVSSASVRRYHSLMAALVINLKSRRHAFAAADSGSGAGPAPDDACGSGALLEQERQKDAQEYVGCEGCTLPRKI